MDPHHTKTAWAALYGTAGGVFMTLLMAAAWLAEVPATRRPWQTLLLECLVTILAGATAAGFVGPWLAKAIGVEDGDLSSLGLVCFVVGWSALKVAPAVLEAIKSGAANWVAGRTGGQPK